MAAAPEATQVREQRAALSEQVDRVRALASPGLAKPSKPRAAPRAAAAAGKKGGPRVLLLIVAAAVFGSVGEPYGAVLGALVIGIAGELAAIVSPNLKDVVAFVILVLVLLFRPEGLRSGRVQMRAEVTA